MPSYKVCPEFINMNKLQSTMKQHDNIYARNMPYFD